jgi:hypothetical protein
MIIESPESSSPTVTRAVAAGLQHKYHSTYLHSIPRWQQPLLRFLGYFPQEVARNVISRFQSFGGLDPKNLDNFNLDEILQARLKDYENITTKFDTITIGAALGGASAHLALTMRSMFLPEAFVFTLRGGALQGDSQSYYLRSAYHASRIASENPELITIQHFDPIHDGWLTRYVNHLRVKLIDLPRAYSEFIKTHLKPGGTICCLQSRAKWLRYKVGERSYFQVGGWGDIQPQEYLEGSARITEYCQAQKIQADAWRLDDFPVEKGPESEWGSEPALADALETFCGNNNYNLICIALPEPHDYSKLAYKAVAQQLALENRPPSGVLVEMFTQFDSSAIINSGLLPVWLIFNTWDSHSFMKTISKEFPDNVPVFFSPLTTFSVTPDIVPFSAWESALGNFDWVNIGTRPSHYPADSWTLLDWQKPLHRWVEKNGESRQVFLDAESILGIAASI